MEIPELTMRTDKSIPEYIFGRNFNVAIPHRSEWVTQTFFESNDIVIYTDGSKTSSGSGSGVHSEVPSLEISTPLGQYSTITQAETYAIIEACAALQDRNVENKKVYICSDSQAVLKALMKHCFTSKLTVNCVKLIMRLSRNNEVNLIWVPGHQDITGNEKADKLACVGSTNFPNGPEPILGLTYSTQRSIIRTFFVNKHTDRWQKLNNCNHSRIFITTPNKAYTGYLLNKSRNELRTLIGVITGHCTLNKHLHRMNLAQSATCRHCNDMDETPIHLLTDCPALNIKRKKYLEEHFLNEQQIKDIKLDKIWSYFKTFNLNESRS